MKIVLVGMITGLALTAAGAANAADMPVKYRPVAPAVFSWTGCYIGVNGGYAWDHSNVHANVQPGATNINAAAAAAANNAGNGTTSEKGGLYGGHAGCQWQNGAVVGGFEVDYDKTNLNGTRDTGNVLVGAFTVRDVDNTRHNWFATARLRLGWAIDRTLIYGTAGFAFVNGSFDRSQRWSFADGCAIVDGLQSCHNGGTSSTKVGAVVGAGAEYAFLGNWTLRAEYLWIVVNGQNFATINSGTNVANQVIGHTWDNTYLNVVRAGVSYKF